MELKIFSLWYSNIAWTNMYQGYHLCKQCRRNMRDAVLIGCGHSFCHECAGFVCCVCNKELCPILKYVWTLQNPQVLWWNGFAPHKLMLSFWKNHDSVSRSILYRPGHRASSVCLSCVPCSCQQEKHSADTLVAQVPRMVASRRKQQFKTLSIN